MGKSALKDKKAQEAIQLKVLQQALKKKSALEKQPHKVFKALYEGKLTAKSISNDNVFSSIISNVKHVCHKRRHQTNFYFIAMTIAQTRAKKLLEDMETVNVLIQVAKVYRYRTREIGDWEVKTYNQNRQISDLLRFLFANYEVPLFMDQAFYEGNGAYIDWFLHLGDGKNLRTAITPVPVSKKMAHFFLQAPAHYSVNEALRFGQIRALGGTKRLAEHINATRLGRSFEHDHFWESVIRFFIQQPMLDPAQILPIVDYIQFIKFGTGRLMNPQTGEIIQDVTPEKPNFSMKGRTVTTLLRDVAQWHHGLQQLQGSASWKPFTVADFSYVEGKEEKQRTYHIQQLLNDKELKIEGRYMRHCVASYVSSCVRGQCSIWSMTVKNEWTTEVKRLVTIEVNRHQCIVQTRGKFNAYPSPKTMGIIKQWAKEEGLKLSKWL